MFWRAAPTATFLGASGGSGADLQPVSFVITLKYK
jgi:hypothetical protein